MKREVREIEEVKYSLTQEEVRFALKSYIEEGNGIVADNAIFTICSNGTAEVVSRYEKLKETK